jgi:GNAT superfamily N-acetyltransferase
MSEILVRQAQMRDLPWLVTNDGHLSEPLLRSKVELGEVVVAELGGAPVGLLRFDRLWSAVPFIAHVRVVEPARRRGAARALVAFVAELARERGVEVLLSSATAGEPEPLAWHMALGFERCGQIDGLNPGAVGELLFSRRIG